METRLAHSGEALGLPKCQGSGEGAGGSDALVPFASPWPRPEAVLFARDLIEAVMLAPCCLSCSPWVFFLTKGFSPYLAPFRGLK